MRVDQTIFARARLQAKMSLRAVAAEAGTSMTAVFNLENSGDVTHLAVGVLHRIAVAVGLTIPDLLEAPAAEESPEGGPMAATDAEVVAALLAHPAGLRQETLAYVLEEHADATAARLSRLNGRLRPMGLGIASPKAAVTLVGLPRVVLTEPRIQEAQRHIGGRARVNRAEAKIVYSVFLGTATLKGLRANANGHLRTGRLVNAGVIQSGPREIDPAELTADVRYSLMLDDLPEVADAGS